MVYTFHKSEIDKFFKDVKEYIYTLNDIKDVYDTKDLMHHNFLFIIYRRGNKYIPKPVLLFKAADGNVVMLMENVYKLIPEDAEFFDDYYHALEECDECNKELQPFYIKPEDYAEIWSIAIQRFDKNGKETDINLTSFTSEYAARKKFEKWKKEDKIYGHVIENDLNTEYSFNDNNELVRVKIINSNLFTSSE